MSSSASALLRQELMAQTENSGTWGNKTNTNLGILELAITGVFAISTTGGSTTLANVDYTADDAKNRTLKVSGSLVSDATIVIPNLKRTYRVNNLTSGSFAVKIKTSGGSSISVTQGTMCDVICDGSDLVTFATPMVVPGTGAPSASTGAVASSVSVTPSGNLSSTTVQAGLVELQGDIDTINAALIASYQPLSAKLTAIAALSITKGNMILGNGSTFAALGVGSDGCVPLASAAAATGLAWSSGAAYYVGGTDVAVADGGTGASTAAGARTALGVTATASDTAYCYRANNLSDVTAATAFGNIKQAASTSATGVVQKADKAAMEAKTADRFPDAAILVSHPLMAKAVGVCDGSGNLDSTNSSGFSGCTRNSQGVFTFTFSTAMSSSTYAVVATPERSASATTACVHVSGTGKTTTTIQIVVRNSADSAVDPTSLTVIVYGDQ